jgi:glycosyltransferase involved in cell wall biosynthesis
MQESSVRGAGTMNRKPRLLFLAFYFPPLHAIASVRAANIAKHLSRIGWEVCVVTADPALLVSPDDPQRVADEMQQHGIRMVYTAHGWRCLSSGHFKRSVSGVGWLAGGICRRIARWLNIDESAGWYGSAYKACAQFRPGEFDLVLATGGPWGTFSLAQRLAQRLQCPFALDYRDPWTMGHAHDGRYGSLNWRRKEAAVLAAASAVAIVSPTWAQILRQHFPRAPKIAVISNGYDPVEFQDVKPQRFEHFTIVYAGSFYPPLATPLLAALKRLQELSPENDCYLHYFGRQDDYLRHEAAVHGVSERVVVHGNVPRQEALSAIRGANVAAVITAAEDHCGPEWRGIVTGKIFEPVGLGTPVLLLAPAESDACEVLATVGNGRGFVPSDSDGIAHYLLDLADGRLPQRGRAEAYSWSELIAKFDLLLREVLSISRIARLAALKGGGTTPE